MAADPELKVLFEEAEAKLSPPCAYEEALQVLDEALARARAAGDSLSQGRALTMKGFVLWSLGDFASSLACLQAAEPYVVADRQLHAFFLRKLGNTLQAVGDTNAAEAAYQRAVEMTRLAGADGETLRTYWELALCRLRGGRPGEAVETMERAVALATTRVPHLVPWTRVIQSLVLTEAGRPAEAWASLQEASSALPPAQRDSWPHFDFAAYRALQALGDEERAAGHLRRAQEIVEREAARIADPRLRESYRTRAWPNCDVCCVAAHR